LQIPILDRLIDKQLRSKPSKAKFFIEEQITIKKGEKEAILDIPCSLFINDFSIAFPSGLKYVYGDSETVGLSEGSEYRSCPAIKITLPDIADQKLKVPIKIGFDSNPKDQVKYTLVIGILNVTTGTLLSTLTVIIEPSLTFLYGISAFFIVLGIYSLRYWQRIRRFWRNRHLKEI